MKVVWRSNHGTIRTIGFQLYKFKDGGWILDINLWRGWIEVKS